ncbi:hypothetical protein GWI33_020567 [Rhynchophorus ferrugineus]|uniref:Uncharacterized protein n=1 Tax=Rhynchophorus ferrugineus TaxID=354439 RepID=A0A834HQN8_RHYFE|nr:hypothetical protein GWI33_020567 [Rhynchophorus ferrugineus]
MRTTLLGTATEERRGSSVDRAVECVRRTETKRERATETDTERRTYVDDITTVRWGEVTSASCPRKVGRGRLKIVEKRRGRGDDEEKTR